jgi:NhaC family Na+:H+ antiporter
MGLRSAGQSYDPSAAQAIIASLEGAYKFNILLLLPPVIMIVLAILKKPIIPVLALSSLVAVLEGTIFQGVPLNKSFSVLYGGVTAETGDELLDKLLSGGGLSNMMSLILIIFCAFIFAGVIERMGLLKVVLKDIAKIACTEGYPFE